MGENTTILHQSTARHPNAERYFKSVAQMRDLCFKGARQLYPQTTLPVERLEYELGVIKQLGFVEYFAEIDRLANLMPLTSASNIQRAIDTLPELKHFPKGKLYQEILDICADLDGAPRHLSVHLGGVVVSRDPLTDLVPLQWSAKGVIITQYDKDDIEALGLVKMDLLGLRILSAIQSTVDSLKAEGLGLCLESVPLDDQRTYALLRSTHTVGVFQLESPGMRELLGRLQPTQFADVLANIALFRLRADIKRNIRRHHLPRTSAAGRGSTGGVYAWAGRPFAARHDAALSAFAAYGFNKAHAATFGLTAYHTAYLKAHYPAHFLTGLLNHQPMGF
ncbi:MAG: DNA polymerase III subunit alpha [Firmicutes bacterium]|nr:DNA polymerase III subunit alpha [candidate division NPL-UPA2 bacterium]